MHDDLKLNLIDMNQTKDMFMNEPSTELLRRALNMSYYQGQKQALDWLQYNVESQDSHTLMTLIEDKLHLLTEQDSKVKIWLSWLKNCLNNCHKKHIEMVNALF